MNCLLKTLLLWLLMLALPMQGAIAATPSCGSQHRHALVASTGEHAAHGDHHHHAANKAASESGKQLSQSSQSQCSTCAACCVGAAIPSTAMHWPLLRPVSMAVFTTPDTLFAGHIPDRLKRPPKAIFV